MSVLHENEYGYIISHSQYINKVYERTSKDGEVKRFEIRDDLFDIVEPYKEPEPPEPQPSPSPSAESSASTASPRKRAKRAKKVKKKLPPEDGELNPLALRVKNNFKKLLELAEGDAVFEDRPASSSCSSPPGNGVARRAAESCYSSTTMLKQVGNISGGNTADTALYQKLNNCDILVPPDCRFHCGDIRLTIENVKNKFFDFIVMDPPWWNKYIRRHKRKKPESGYEMLYHHDLISLPLQELLCPGTIVAVWCTNNFSHEMAIKRDMFTAWDVLYCATWFWMKVTKSGESVGPFSEWYEKQPYERIILGVKDPATDQKMPEQGKVVVSVPSALHSHKPPLNDLLRPYVFSEQPRCLELFARYLLPHTTSLGMEPLRWQHSLLYTQKD